MQAPDETREARTVAVEVSALAGGDRDRALFVEFVLATLRAEPSFDAAPWALRSRRSALAEGAEVAARATTPLARGLVALGAPVPVRWAAPRRADVVHLASGPLPLRIGQGSVVTVHSAEDVLGPRDPRAARRVRSHLVRAVRDGAIVHALSEEVADAVIAAVGIDRAAVVVAAPGVRALRDDAPPGPAVPDVDVVAGRDGAGDEAILEALRASGRSAAPLSAAARPRGRCLVVASPRDGFPATILQSLASGTPVVAARTETTAALLTGAVRLVERASSDEFAQAAIELAADGHERTIAVAAGLARARDFTWDRRAADLARIYRRAQG